MPPCLVPLQIDLSLLDRVMMYQDRNLAHAELGIERRRSPMIGPSGRSFESSSSESSLQSGGLAVQSKPFRFPICVSRAASLRMYLASQYAFEV